MFWLLVILLTVLAAAFIALPVLKPELGVGSAGSRREALNATIYEDDFAELERLRQNNAISDEQYRERESELSRRLIADADTADADAAPPAEVKPSRPALVLLLVLMLPVAAWQLYTHLGSWDAWRMTQRVAQVNESLAGEDGDPNELLGLLGDLADFNQGSEQTDWLFVQAQTAMRVGAYPVAASLFARLSQLEAGNADLLAWQIQALYLARGRQLDDEINGLIDRALAINPHQSTILGIRGMNAFENGDFALAAQAWGQALAGTPPGSPSATMLQQGIQQANAALGVAPDTVAHPSAPGATERSVAAPESGNAGFSSGIKVRVELDSTAQVIPGSTVFVIASAPEGGMPYAVVRLPVEGLPTEVILDDSTAMAPGRSLSQQRAVKVTARVSRSGNAIGQAGDWQGRSAVMTPGTMPPVVAIHIDQQI
jgi:cytochrome c-type biogenesis protein CcmH